MSLYILTTTWFQFYVNHRDFVTLSCVFYSVINDMVTTAITNQPEKNSHSQTYYKRYQLNSLSLLSLWTLSVWSWLATRINPDNYTDAVDTNPIVPAPQTPDPRSRARFRSRFTLWIQWTFIQ